MRKAEVVPFECVARGYLAGSGWADYRRRERSAASGFRRASSRRERLPEPIFTPATKSERGHDDERDLRGRRLRGRHGGGGVAEKTTLSLYERARDDAEARGLLLADTKLEFGRIDGRFVWIDEAFTPDSSRYWDSALYRPGRSPVSYDKQFVRDWLESTGWNKRPPAPRLPEGVIRTTREKYLEGFRILTGALPRHVAP